MGELWRYLISDVMLRLKILEQESTKNIKECGLWVAVCSHGSGQVTATIENITRSNLIEFHKRRSSCYQRQHG